MKNKWIRTALACMLAAICLATPASAMTIGGGTVTGSSVRLRSSADTATTANVITEMPAGTFLLVEEKLNGWYKVSCNGTVGYVSADYVRFSETLNGTYTCAAATTGTSINLRAGASTATAVVKNLPAAGTKLTVNGVSGQWLYVTDAAGAAGYIRSDLLSYTGSVVPIVDTTVPAGGTPTVTPAVSTRGDQLVATARQYLGYAYVWGGMSPTTGFDCSGFANYVCKQHDISLHRVAQDIYSNDGVWVSKDSLQTGDLLFFGYGPYSVTHMGIYIGGGQFIHASTSSTGVIISELSSTYYTRMYVGAKRVV